MSDQVLTRRPLENFWVVPAGNYMYFGANGKNNGLRENVDLNNKPGFHIADRKQSGKLAGMTAVNEDMATPHTMRHEFVHAHCDENFYSASKTDLREGVTEYFARHAGPSPSEEGRACACDKPAEKVTGLVGSGKIDHETLCRAYFGGDAGAIKQLLDLWNPKEETQ